MQMHRFLHELRIQFEMALSPKSDGFYTTLLVLVFAAVFLIVGVLRLVEFKGLGFGTKRMTFFYVSHILGCVAFSTGLVVFAVDPHMHFRTEMASLFGIGFCLLTPVQIYLALVRRVRPFGR